MGPPFGSMRVAVCDDLFALQILPSASTAMPVLPAPVGFGTLPTKVPLFLRWPIVQLLPQLSDELTHTSPFRSTASPCAWEAPWVNGPRIVLPSGLTLRTRAPNSLAQTQPAASMARPYTGTL